MGEFFQRLLCGWLSRAYPFLISVNWPNKGIPYGFIVDFVEIGGSGTDVGRRG